MFPGMFGLVFGVFGMLLYDGRRVWESGMLQGYNTITWAVVILQVTLLLQMPLSGNVNSLRIIKASLFKHLSIRFLLAC